MKLSVKSILYILSILVSISCVSAAQETTLTGTLSTGIINTGSSTTGIISTGIISTGGTCSMLDFRTKREELQAKKKADKDRISLLYKEIAQTKDKWEKSAKKWEIKTLEKEIRYLNTESALSYRDEFKANNEFKTCKKNKKSENTTGMLQKIETKMEEIKKVIEHL